MRIAKCAPSVAAQTRTVSTTMEIVKEVVEVQDIIAVDITRIQEVAVTITTQPETIAAIIVSRIENHAITDIITTMTEVSMTTTLKADSHAITTSNVVDTVGVVEEAAVVVVAITTTITMAIDNHALPNSSATIPPATQSSKSTPMAIMLKAGESLSAT